jgi:ATP-dependent DNA helicase RecG
VQAPPAGRRRLAQDEALALSLDVAARRRRLTAGRAPVLALDDARHAALLAALPHAPTAAQARAIECVRRDLSRPERGHPMARLLQGDVGSGKTLVAFYALLAALSAGRQAALMAPTAILSAQHAANLRALLARAFGEQAPQVALLAGDGAPSDERRARAVLESGAAALAIGTHALQTARVRFRDLAVTVVDEQHRFGVLQRSRFREKGAASHLLVMTATPIPRTLALTAYGELDVTVLDGLPPGCAGRATELVPSARQPAMWRALARAVAQGERGYVVCPSIGAGRTGGRESVANGDDEGTSVADMLRRVTRALGPGVSIGAVHGRMPAAERDAALDAFRRGELSVLVATVLVEVGLDVPQATFVVVPDAARFGLATLHQIRGRVGRGGRCLLLGPVAEPLARARVAVLLQTEDGFRLAEHDLQLRGPGEMLGTRQSGLPDFHALDPVADVALLSAARESALALARPLSDAALAALRRRVFPELQLRAENLLAGG